MVTMSYQQDIYNMSTYALPLSKTIKNYKHSPIGDIVQISYHSLIGRVGGGGCSESDDL